MNVAGVDPSTARIGLADTAGRAWSITARAGADDRARRLHELRRGLVDIIRRHPPIPDVVAIEGYGLDTPGRLGLVRLGEVGGVIRLAMFELDVSFVEIPPTSVKRFATGNGRASKEQMVDRARDLGAAVSNHDEADAWLIRRMVLAANGEVSIEHAYEADAIANCGVDW